MHCIKLRFLCLMNYEYLAMCIMKNRYYPFLYTRTNGTAWTCTLIHIMISVEMLFSFTKPKLLLAIWNSPNYPNFHIEFVGPDAKNQETFGFERPMIQIFPNFSLKILWNLSRSTVQPFSFSNIYLSLEYWVCNPFSLLNVNRVLAKPHPDFR